MEPTIAELNETLTADLSASKAIVTKLTEERATFETLLADAQATINAQAEKLTSAAVELAANAENYKAKEAEILTAKAELEKVTGELATLKNAVANNPAMAHAAAGRAPITEPKGGVPQGDLWAQYNAIKDPTSRARFWQTHSGELRKIARNNPA